MSNPDMRGNVAAISSHARAALENAEYTPIPRSSDAEPDEDFSEYARLIPQDET
jgi:hypothetical protein